MDVTVSELMTNFLDSPLVVWVKTFGALTSNSEDNLSLFMELVDGVFLHKIMTHIDPSPTNQRVNKHVNNDVNLRVQNLNVVVRHIKTYYQECLQQLIVMNLPNVLAIGKDPLSEKAMEEMKRLLLLILGCAVQCERKEEFIEKIKLLDIETQAAIVSHIQEVTHNQENVLDLQWLELAELPPEELDSLSRVMAFHLRKLIDERDNSAEVIVELSQERDYLLLQQPSSPPPVTRSPACPPLEGPITLLCREDRQHLAVELADCKAKLRRWRQELELVEENMLLEISQKRSMNESAHLGWELEQPSLGSEAKHRLVLIFNAAFPPAACKSFVLELNESASSQLLKLEKENQGLQGTIQELREAALSMQESQLRALELEKENQGLSKKLERLQTLLEQEKQTSQDMGSLGEELLKGKRKLERLLEAVQTEKCRQISDLTMEKERLAQTVASLRQRAQVEGEARVREVEEENRALHQSVSTVSAKLTQLEVEQDWLRERSQRAEQLEEEVARLERSCDQLQKQSAALQATREHAEALERNNSALEQDNRRLKKLEDTAQNTVLQLEILEEENEELRQQVEALRPAAAKLPQLQRENTVLEHERAELVHSVEELRGLGKKAERLELSYQDLDSENQRLQQSLEQSGERVRGLEQELHDSEQESQQLRRQLEERQAAGRRLESLEQEGQVLEQELGQAVKERRQLEKEVRWLRQKLEVKETALDEGMVRLSCLEKEGCLREKELNYLRETSAKVKELESENKELQKQATIDKRTLATLREDLVNEKLKGQQQWNELEKLSQELEKIGLNRERLLQEEHSCEDIKYKILETKIDSTLKMTMEIRQEKIQGLESRLQESTNLNLQLRTELATVKKSLEALKQRQEEEEAHLHPSLPKASQEKWETEEREATAQLLKLKDRLIDVEKNNAALETEKQLQREQLKQLDVQNTQLSAQILALQRQTAALQEHNTALHMQMAKLQVESSALGSQSASLLAQNTALQGQIQASESQAEKLRQQGEEERAGREAALHEHERLLELHNRQAAEYEQLIGQHTCLKVAHRALEQEHRLLQSKCVHIPAMQRRNRQTLLLHLPVASLSRVLLSTAPCHHPCFHRADHILPLFLTSDNGTVSKAKDPYRTPGGSSESVNSPEGVLGRQKGVKLGYSAHSTSAIHAMSDTRPGCSPQGFSSEASPAAHLASFGHQTKDSFACDDATDPHWELKAEEGVTFPDDPWRQEGLALPGHPRPSSPGSEMVTLAEFLQESSVLSAPIVKASSWEDMPTPDACHSPSLQDGIKAPTSCSTPTVKPLPLGGTREPRAQKPGQSVKPNVRVPEIPNSSQQSQTLPSWVGGSLGMRACPSQPVDTRGGLSRTFSLASADLLHSSGPESYRPEGSDWGSGDAVLRARVLAREKPQSVRLGGPSTPPVDVGCRPLDPRRLSLAPPKESFSLESPLPLPQHHSSSFSLCGSPGYTSRHDVTEQPPTGNRGSPQLPQHRATEVAMVTPVQAVPVLKEEEEREVWQDVRRESSPQIKGQEALGVLSITDKYPKSTPAPPTPSEDPQTIWYEYGCV
nr:protein Daple-like [Paramormyrops kingsleyae]